MSSLLRTSAVRAISGGILALIALMVTLFVLPDARNNLQQKEAAERKAAQDLRTQMEQLKELQDTVSLIRKGQEIVNSLESTMPKGSIGELQWVVNKAVHDLAKTNGVRLQNVRYGAPGRDGAKGTDIENLDVEFQVVGVYEPLKKFMLALESSGLPFGLSAAKLEESPDGARQTVTLRAFRRATGPRSESKGEES